MNSLKKLLGSWHDPLKDLHSEIEGLRREFSSRSHTPSAYLDAFRRTPYEQTNVMFLGITPYPTVRPYGLQMATGVALEHRETFPLSPSLREFYKEMELTVGETIPKSKDLSYLCEQGVLLLNSSMTTAPNTPAAHQKEWREFMERFIVTLSTQKPVYFVFMGNNNHKYKKFVYTTFYNSQYKNVGFPLSYDNKPSNFINSGAFRDTNRYLAWQGLPEIIWNKKEWEEHKTKEQVVNGSSTSSSLSNDTSNSKTSPQAGPKADP